MKLLMTLFLFLSIHILSFSQTFQEKPSYHIKGSINGRYNNEYIKLFRLQGDTLLLSVDSVKVENGRFHFNGHENTKDFAIITIGNDHLRILSVEVVLENGTIEVKMDTISTACGTYFNDLYSSFKQEYRETKKKAWAAQNEGDYSGIYFNKADSLLCKMIRENLSNVVGQKIITEYKGELAYDSIIGFYNQLEKIHRHNPWLTDENVRFARNIKEEEDKRNHLVQTQFIDIEIETPEGEKKQLSEYVGHSNYLFIDFWASWCSPCLKEIPNIKQIYEKYKDKGLEVLSISVDTNKKNWKNTMKKMDMPWKQFVLPTESKAQKEYGINSIPCGILISQDGMIMQMSLRTVFLEIILKEMLKED